MHLTDLISQTDISTQAYSSQGTNWNNEKNKFKPVKWGAYQQREMKVFGHHFSNGNVFLQYTIRVLNKLDRPLSQDKVNKKAIMTWWQEDICYENYNWQNCKSLSAATAFDCSFSHFSSFHKQIKWEMFLQNSANSFSSKMAVHIRLARNCIQTALTSTANATKYIHSILYLSFAVMIKDFLRKSQRHICCVRQRFS